MSDFVEAANLDRVPPGAARTVKVAGASVALFNVDGTIYAIDDTCPHMGGSLGLGVLTGTVIKCPVHGMTFDVTNGCFADSSGFGVASYPVKVVDGKIMVAIRSNEKTS